MEGRAEKEGVGLGGIGGEGGEEEGVRGLEGRRRGVKKRRLGLGLDGFELIEEVR